eukprot:1234015-Rhodomonas_salina.1
MGGCGGEMRRTVAVGAALRRVGKPRPEVVKRKTERSKRAEITPAAVSCLLPCDSRRCACEPVRADGGSESGIGTDRSAAREGERERGRDRVTRGSAALRLGQEEEGSQVDGGILVRVGAESDQRARAKESE